MIPAPILKLPQVNGDTHIKNLYNLLSPLILEGPAFTHSGIPIFRHWSTGESGIHQRTKPAKQRHLVTSMKMSIKPAKPQLVFARQATLTLCEPPLSPLDNLHVRKLSPKPA